MKLLSINELAHLTGMQRETVRKKLASIEPVPGPHQAKLYDSSKALPAVYEATNYTNEHLSLVKAKREGQEIQNEILRKERVLRADVLSDFGTVLGGMAGMIRALPYLKPEDRTDFLTRLRNFLDDQQGPTGATPPPKTDL